MASAACQMNALIFLSHHTQPRAMAALEKLRRELPPDTHLFPIFDLTPGLCSFDLLPNDALCITFPQIMADSPYSGKPGNWQKSFYPDCQDLILLWFFRLWSYFDFYWFVEYDVRYTGNWRDFFSEFLKVDSDMLATTLFRYAFRPTWEHWEGLRVDPSIGHENWVRALCCIARYSHTAFSCLDQAYRKGYSGHQECLIPTVLLSYGLILEDFGGDGEFVRTGNVNRFYFNTPTIPGLLPGSFTVAPNHFDPTAYPPLLQHPVKG